MNFPRPLIAVAGDAAAAEDSASYLLAADVGAALIDAGFRIVTGGLGGVMEAAGRGARRSAAYREGDVVALLPGRDPTAANSFSDIVIPTGLDNARNTLVGLSDALVAVGGGAGTLSEIAHAWLEKRLIVALRTKGWSGELADRRIDSRVRYPDIADDRVYGASTGIEAAALVATLLPRYRRRHGGIVRRTEPR